MTTLAYKPKRMFEKVSGWEIIKTIASALVPIMLFVFGGIWNKWQLAKKAEEDEKRVAQKEQTDTLKQVVTELRDMKAETKTMNTHILDKISATNATVLKLEETVTQNYTEFKEDIKRVHTRIDDLKK